MRAMFRLFLGLSGVLGAAGVILGAVGAHVLRARLSVEAYSVYGQGVSYLLPHAALLAAIAIALHRWPRSWPLRFSAVALGVGMLMFSGGLIGWSVFGAAWARACAPLGGTALIAAWLGLVAAAVRIHD
jgi:uncharacterized membrane protein YgdD (TMEM256/DUF423 family)